jgi:hypothetical protein
MAVLLALVAAGPAALDPVHPAWKPETVDTASKSDYFSPEERGVVLEINRARTDPPEYARRVLAPMRDYYRDKLLRFPGEMPVSTVEGRPALDECIKVLMAAKPAPPLSPSKGLALAARDQARDQGKTGAIGHGGSDGSTMESRMSRYGTWGGAAGENIDYGNGDARRIVASMLIDDGVPSRGHRQNLLDARFRAIGVAIGTHPSYGHLCVIDLAGSYEQGLDIAPPAAPPPARTTER